MARNYGLCNDPHCDEPEESTDLFHGVCAGCLEANNDEEEFRSANEIEMSEAY